MGQLRVQEFLLQDRLIETRTVLASLVSPVGEIPFRPDQVMHMQANIERLKAATGWAPQVPFGTGIAQTVAWYRNHRA